MSNTKYLTLSNFMKSVMIVAKLTGGLVFLSVFVIANVCMADDQQITESSTQPEKPDIPESSISRGNVGIEPIKMDELDAIEKAVGNRHMEKSYIRFKQKNPTKSYSKVLFDRNERKRVSGGNLMMGSSAAFVGGGLITAWAIANIRKEAFTESEMGILVPMAAVIIYGVGIIGTIGGVAGIVLGVKKMRLANRKMEQLKPVVEQFASKASTKSSKKIKFTGIAPLIMEHRLYAGAGVHYTFF